MAEAAVLRQNKCVGSIKLVIASLSQHRHFHNDVICMNENCSDRMCRKRHPHKCKYFLNFGYCKFEASCAYLHPVADVVELTLLKHELKCLKTEIEMIKNKLIYLEKVEIAEHFPLQIKPTC